MHSDSKRDINVLLVDDNRDVRTFFEDRLKRLGYVVATVANAEEALRLFACEPASVVVTDILMDELNGVGLITQLRERFPETKIIAMSGGGYVSSQNWLTLASTAGALRTLEKPFSIPDLVAAINEVLEVGA
jgi:DNA-binding NtrC family response regulator